MTLGDLQQTIEQLFVYTSNKITCDVLHLEIPSLRVYNKGSLIKLAECEFELKKLPEDVSKWSDWQYRGRVGILAGYDYHKYKMSKHVFEQYFDRIMSLIPEEIHVVIQTSYNIQLTDQHAADLLAIKKQSDGNSQVKGVLDVVDRVKGQIDQTDHEVKSLLTDDNRFVDRERCDQYIHHAIIKHADRVSLIDSRKLYQDLQSDVCVPEKKMETGILDLAHHNSYTQGIMIDYVTNNFGHLVTSQYKGYPKSD